MKRVFVITDCCDVAFLELKWSVLNHLPPELTYTTAIELIPVEEFSVLNAAFLARLMSEFANVGDIIWVVINPQKNRSDRIFGRTRSGVIFFGANTGALSWLIKDLGVEELGRIEDPGFITFGGKFVHAPNVARMAQGLKPERFSYDFDLVDLNPLHPQPGQVVHIDNFGLIKIFGERPAFDEGQKLKITRDGSQLFEAKFSNRMMSNDDSEWILFSGSSLNSLPELGAVRDKAKYKEYNIKIGDKLTWSPI